MFPTSNRSREQRPMPAVQPSVTTVRPVSPDRGFSLRFLSVFFGPCRPSRSGVSGKNAGVSVPGTSETGIPAVQRFHPRSRMVLICTDAPEAGSSGSTRNLCGSGPSLRFFRRDRGIHETGLPLARRPGIISKRACPGLLRLPDVQEGRHGPPMTEYAQDNHICDGSGCGGEIPGYLYLTR